jgi:hypothetical protein
MYQVLYDKLIEVAQAHEKTTYDKIGSLVSSKNYNFELWRELDEIDRFVAQNDRPMISAVVINPQKGKPGQGFWACAAGLGKFAWGQDEDRFWHDELDHVWSTK